jgi:prepilin-type N-terminal cleavage/methylation domain-containing protein
MKIFNTIASRRQAGDTIIEVLIAVSILALVMTVAYQSTSRSLQNGIDSSSRQQALALAEQQIEIIKNAAANNVSAYQAYVAAGGGSFCIAPSNMSANYGISSVSSTSCHLINSRYNLSDTYAAGEFTISANWPSTVSGSSGISKLAIYYR